MESLRRFVLVLLSLALFQRAAHAGDACAGKSPGSVHFFAEKIAADAAVPAEAPRLVLGKPMFALFCFAAPVGPQPLDGNKLEVSYAWKPLDAMRYEPDNRSPRYHPPIAVASPAFVLDLHPYDELETLLKRGTYELTFVAKTKGGGTARGSIKFVHP